MCSLRAAISADRSALLSTAPDHGLTAVPRRFEQRTETNSSRLDGD